MREQFYLVEVPQSGEPTVSLTDEDTVINDAMRNKKSAWGEFTEEDFIDVYGAEEIEADADLKAALAIAREHGSVIENDKNGVVKRYAPDEGESCLDWALSCNRPAVYCFAFDTIGEMFAWAQTYVGPQQIEVQAAMGRFVENRVGSLAKTIAQKIEKTKAAATPADLQNVLDKMDLADALMREGETPEDAIQLRPFLRAEIERRF